MVSINTIAILFLFGAIAIGGALAFSRIQSFFSNFQLPSLGDISIPRPFVGPERMDVAFPSPEREAAGLPPIDIVPEFGRQDPRRSTIEEISPDQPVSISDFVNRFVDVVPEFGRRDPRREAFMPEPIIEPATSQLNLGGFQGEAISAPLGALPLSQIIEQFMVSASEAANIKFIAQQGGDPFAEPSNIFGENPPAVTAGLGFEGLSLEEIARRIGQPISNF